MTYAFCAWPGSSSHAKVLTSADLGIMQAHPVDGVDIKSISVPTVGPVPHGLLHQGSGVSVNSDYKLSLADLEAFKAAEDASMDMPNLAASALQYALMCMRSTCLHCLSCSKEI